MSKEEAELIRYYQVAFVKTYLCKPPTELLEVIIVFHRISKALEKAVQNIAVQLLTPNSNLNIQLAQQINTLQQRMSR